MKRRCDEFRRRLHRHAGDPQLDTHRVIKVGMELFGDPRSSR
jgi:hypothetical protein